MSLTAPACFDVEVETSRWIFHPLCLKLYHTNSAENARRTGEGRAGNVVSGMHSTWVADEVGVNRSMVCRWTRKQFVVDAAAG